MGKSKEDKVVEVIANSVEDHWFSPVTVARNLAEQPYFTVDRVMELVLWIIEKNARRHERETNTSSEGLWLAHELDKVVDSYQKKYKFENLKFPPTPAQAQAFIKSLPTPAEKQAAEWYRSNEKSSID